MLPLNRTSFRPGDFWPDDQGVHINAHGGGVLFHEGIYYWYGEHKIAGSAGNLAHVGVHVYASADLYNWHDDGIALRVSEDPASPIARGCILERPKVLFNARTRQFVMWFHLEPPGAGYTGSMSAVAVASQAAGPFQLQSWFRPNAGVWPLNVPESEKRALSPRELASLTGMDLAGGPRPYYPRHRLYRRDFSDGQMARDQTLFVDAGIAYHIYASEGNGTLHISQLTEDYLRPSGRYVRIFPGRFNEAPALMKWRGKYFLISSDCTGWAANPARIAMADDIFGPWEELGNPCLGTGGQIANTFNSQSTFILPLAGRPDAFIFMADRWQPEDAIDGRYVWLPLEFHHGVPMFAWHDEWSLKIFDRKNR